MTTAKKIWPVPEILEGGEPFKLKETTKNRGMVCTNLPGRIMYVPTGDDAYGRMGRLHEMAHVAITPTEGMKAAMDEGIMPDYMNIAEDMRVHRFLEDKRLPIEESIPKELLDHRIKGWELEEDFKTAALMAVATYRLPEFEKIVDGLPDWDLNIRDIVYECDSYLDYDTGFDGAKKAAEYLQGLFEKDGHYAHGGSEPHYQNREDLDWGEMEIKTPHLDVRLPQRKQVRAVKPKEYGVAIMFPTRLDQDDKIFGQIKRVAKGTVLIDVSSSMHIEAYQIEELVKDIPAVVVATYSGSATTGHLTIIAKDGNMLSERAMSDCEWPGGNVVDGPALEWLAKQSQPRIWVCDGQVSGCYDTFAPKFTKLAKEIVDNNKIRRVDKIEEVADAILKR